MAVAAVSAMLAAAVLLVFLHQYRDNLTSSSTVHVLVARSLVPQGTPGQIVASEHLYREEKLRKSQLKDGAITDPSALNDKAAVADIYPGHQLRAKDFTEASDRVLNRLSGYSRAMTVPVDAAHGMIGKARAGDRVDVVATFNTQSSGPSVATTVARNVLVLSIPTKAKRGSSVGSSANQSATLRVNDDQAAQIAAAADGGKVWLVLRPPVGARSHSTSASNGRHVHARVSLDATVGGSR